MADVNGAEVRRARTRLGLKQTELAARVGVHPITVSRWERDEVRIPEPTARLLRLLGASAATKPRRRRR